MAKTPVYLTERELVRRCLADDPEAWQRLRVRYSRSIKAASARALGKKQADSSTVDEIEANVLNALCTRNFEALRSFDSSRGSLRTYLAALARREVVEYWRQRERKAKEVFLSDIHIAEPARPEDTTRSQLNDLQRKLRNAEKEYLNTHLLRQPTESEAGRFSAAYGRKLIERILKTWHEIREEG